MPSIQFTNFKSLLCGVFGAGLISLAATPTPGVDLDAEIEAFALEDLGAELGIQVAVEGRGVVYSRAPAVPRSTASAIKTAILLDLFTTRGDLDQIPVGLEALLRPGTHPAFNGFSVQALKSARAGLVGRTYMELARVMMGRTGADNQVYNAACNVIMVKLGGPKIISQRLRGLDPAFAGFDINRYMESWNGDGDNLATPEAMVILYSMASSGQIPGLVPAKVDALRDLLLDYGDGSPGSVYEKGGTLYPSPMVRVHAGYVERSSGNLVYAVMGEISETKIGDPAEAFSRLMTAVDLVTRKCQMLYQP